MKNLKTHFSLKDRVTDEKRIRGGVFFVDEFPLTPSGKPNRSKVKEMVTKLVQG